MTPLLDFTRKKRIASSSQEWVYRILQLEGLPNSWAPSFQISPCCVLLTVTHGDITFIPYTVMAVKQVFIVEKIWLCQGYKELEFRQEITETLRNSCKNQAMKIKKRLNH